MKTLVLVVYHHFNIIFWRILEQCRRPQLPWGNQNATKLRAVPSCRLPQRPLTIRNMKTLILTKILTTYCQGSGTILYPYWTQCSRNHHRWTKKEMPGERSELNEVPLTILGACISKYLEPNATTKRSWF